jgi:hypothetical protein
MRDCLDTSWSSGPSAHIRLRFRVSHVYGRPTVLPVNKIEHYNITNYIRTFLITRNVQSLVDIRRIFVSLSISCMLLSRESFYYSQIWAAQNVLRCSGQYKRAPLSFGLLYAAVPVNIWEPGRDAYKFVSVARNQIFRSHFGEIPCIAAKVLLLFNYVPISTYCIDVLGSS